MLLQAKDFYTRAYDLIDSHVLLDPNGSFILVHLAICTNLAEITTDLGLPLQSEYWKESLRECIMAIPPAPASPVYQHFSNVCISYGVEFEDLDMMPGGIAKEKMQVRESSELFLEQIS